MPSIRRRRRQNRSTERIEKKKNDLRRKSRRTRLGRCLERKFHKNEYKVIIGHSLLVIKRKKSLIF